MSDQRHPGGLQNTTRKGDVARVRPGRATIPCLTILCHPDPRRIGDRVLLSALYAGRKVALSRLEPSFGAPGSPTGAPLEDPFISRKPVYLAPTRQPGGVTLSTDSSGVTVDGAPIDGEQTFDEAVLARGVIVVLVERVALLLHSTSNPAMCPIDGLVGGSDAIAFVRQEVKRVAVTDVPVLVRGETGTGKECVARAIHEGSRRSAQPWVAVNMATLAESVAVSSLFGHAKGAFTGANQRHRGLFEQASKGTLFLDEVGETPERVQPMLLRTLETGTIVPLGDEVEQRIDVRVIAATDSNLEQDMTGGSFRGALFHRLAGYEVHLPPLRERRDDIPRLFIHFLMRELTSLGEAELLSATEVGGEARVPIDVITRLVNHPLPGNVRQLRNAARHLAVGSQGEPSIVSTPSFERLLGREADAVVAERSARGASSASPARRSGELTLEELLGALEQSGWSPARTANHLGLATSTLHDLMRRHGIRRAANLPDAELRDAQQRLGGDLGRLATELRVSERALVLTLKQRGLREDD